MRGDCLRPDGTACAGTISVLFVLAILFASLPTVSAGDLQTDYVRYVITDNIQWGSLEIEVLDNDNDDLKVANAMVSGTISSGNIAIDENTDAYGKLIIENLEVGVHSYNLAISAPSPFGYENRTGIIDNFIIEARKVTTLKLYLNYNPFDVALAENSGSLTREWSAYAESQTYEYRMNTDFGVYKYNVYQLGDRRWIHTGKYSTTSGYGKFATSGYTETRWVGDRTYYVTSSVFLDYDSSGKAIYADYFNQTYTAPTMAEFLTAGSALRNVMYYPNYVKAEGHYERWYSPDRLNIYKYIYPYWVHFGGRSDLGPGVTIPPQNFAITYNEYQSLSADTYFRNNGSFVRTDTTDYSLAPWENVQTLITATPRNGYTGGVKLTLESDNGITATLGKNELTFASPASTTLTLKPKENTKGSLHPVVIKAYDSNGRLVIGGARKPALPYDLDLTTRPKPDPMSVSYLLSAGTSYISVGVSGYFDPVRQTNALSGATVELRYSNGAVFASGTTGSNGTVTFTPSSWPLNTNLDVTASYPGYYTGTSSVNTGNGGTKGASIGLSKGDFALGMAQRADVRMSDGKIVSYQEGKFVAKPPWGVPGWLGGSVGLTQQYDSTYYTSSLGTSSVNPSSPVTVRIDVYPKQYVITSTRVFGQAGSPTNYQRHTDVGVTIGLPQNP